MSDRSADLPWIGVVTVSYRSAGIVAECLESLTAMGYPRLKVLVVDNASPDGSADAVRDWAQGAAPFTPPADWPTAVATVSSKPRPFAEFDAEGAENASFEALADITLIHSGANLGYAGGANIGLRALRRHPEMEMFWVLNPDCVVDPGAAWAFAAAARRVDGRFALMGGRASFFGEPEIVQADGGRFRPWVGRGGSVNKNRRADACAPPDGSELDYIHGMCMVASRVFIEQVGLMDPSWFLYYEEVDWAYRRGDLPLLVAPEARIRHRSGASSREADDLPAPALAYISARNGQRFMARWYPWRPWYRATTYLIWIMTLVRAYFPVRAWPQFWASLAGLHGLPPPPQARRALDPAVWRMLAERSRR